MSSLLEKYNELISNNIGDDIFLSDKSLPNTLETAERQEKFFFVLRHWLSLTFAAVSFIWQLDQFNFFTSQNFSIFILVLSFFIIGLIPGAICYLVTYWLLNLIFSNTFRKTQRFLLKEKVEKLWAAWQADKQIEYKRQRAVEDVKKKERESSLTDAIDLVFEKKSEILNLVNQNEISFDTHEIFQECKQRTYKLFGDDKFDENKAAMILYYACVVSRLKNLVNPDLITKANIADEIYALSTSKFIEQEFRDVLLKKYLDLKEDLLKALNDRKNESESLDEFLKDITGKFNFSIQLTKDWMFLFDEEGRVTLSKFFDCEVVLSEFGDFLHRTRGIILSFRGASHLPFSKNLTQSILLQKIQRETDPSLRAKFLDTLYLSCHFFDDLQTPIFHSGTVLNYMLDPENSHFIEKYREPDLENSLHADKDVVSFARNFLAVQKNFERNDAEFNRLLSKAHEEYKLLLVSINETPIDDIESLRSDLLSRT